MAKGRRARVSDVVESATRASERLRWLDRPSYRLDTIVTWERTNHHHDHRRPLGTPTTTRAHAEPGSPATSPAAGRSWSSYTPWAGGIGSRSGTSRRSPGSARASSSVSWSQASSSRWSPPRCSAQCSCPRTRSSGYWRTRRWGCWRPHPGRPIRPQRHHPGGRSHGHRRWQLPRRPPRPGRTRTRPIPDPGPGRHRQDHHRPPPARGGPEHRPGRHIRVFGNQK